MLDNGLSYQEVSSHLNVSYHQNTSSIIKNTLPTTFEESSLQFRFLSAWRVLAYDKHRYYRILSGHGFKGCDFVGLLHEKTPVLIEVKNYQHRLGSPKSPDIQDIVGSDPQLIDKFIRKMDDTRSAIRIIHRRLWRRRVFRLWHWLRRWLGSDIFGQTEWQLWADLHNAIETPTQPMHLVLWLRTEQSYPEFSHQQILTLKAMLRQEVDKHFQNHKFYIADIANNPYASVLEVSDSKIG